MVVYLGLGSNLGNRLGNLQAGLRRVQSAARLDAVSSLYQSDPVGPGGQPPYWNAAARIDTDLTPHELLRLVKRIEWEMGRRPGEVWGPRPLDIDILLMDGATVAAQDLTIPHPRIAERPFVLVPLSGIAADVMHPLLGRTIAALRHAAGDAGLHRVAGADWLSARYLSEPGAAVSG